MKLSERLGNAVGVGPFSHAVSDDAPVVVTAGLLREAAELARSVEDGPVVAIDSAGEHVRLFAEGGPLDRMATSARVLAMDGQRVRLVPEAGQGGGE